MYQLSYRSISSPTLVPKDLEEILAESKATNLEKDITGCLVYYKQEFVQILEGDKKYVKEIYNRIKRDKRHHSVNLLWEGKVPERYFENWNMAFYHGPIKSKTNEDEKRFVNNMQLLSDFTSIATSPLLMFWTTVRALLRNDYIQEPS